MKKTKMLKKNYEFKNVLSKGKYYSGDFIEAFVKKDTNQNINFLGIAVSVKTAKAVKRNQIKRWIRENYTLIENRVKPGCRIVFLWKKKVSYEFANFENIKKDMEKILDKAGILEEKSWKNYFFG